MPIKVSGAEELSSDIQDVIELLDDSSIASQQLSRLMSKHVHVKTGYLKKSIYYKNDVSGANAPYAGIEEERGGEHAYGTMAIDRFDIDKYADEIWSPIE